MGASMTTRQIELARHALGLPNDRRRSYRNRFYLKRTLAEDSSYMEWSGLVAAGLAEMSPGENLDCFYLTRAGAEMALLSGESLDPEDFP